ncbi:MAG: SIS domain-containing protein [Anaerolineales bacterium]
MIVVQSPLRVSLFGGGTDFPDYYLEHGGCVLSTTIDKRVFITAKHRFDRKLRVGYTQTEMVDSLDEIQHDLIREALRVTGLHDSVEISTMADIPTRGSGLGSSSTVTVGALLTLWKLQGEQPSSRRLAEEACRLEIETLGKPIGVQDQYAAAYGGMRFMEFRQNGTIEAAPVYIDASVLAALDENLLLFYTGITRKSESVLTEQKDNIADRLSVLDDMKALAYLARERLESGDPDAVGELLHETWTLKRQLASGITSTDIDSIYEAARTAGALGGKITGAGGGGFMLLYVPVEKQSATRQALANLQELPFQLDPQGAKVILDYRNGAGKATQTSIAASHRSWSLPISEGQEPIISYLGELHSTLDELATERIEQAVEVLHQARIEGRKIFIMGNGGSASTASHFACDLGKNTRIPEKPDFRVLALTDNMATFSALANDDGYENVFLGQISSLLERGDVAIGISTSGNSENVVRAMEFAEGGGAQTIAFTGFDGGRLGKIVDLEVHVPSDNIERVEDIHLMLEHLICTALREMAMRKPVEWRAERAAPGLDRKRVSLLYEFNRELAEPNGAEGVLTRTLGLAVNKLGAASGSMLMLDHGSRLAGGSVAYEGLVEERSPELLEDVYEGGLAGWTARRRRPALVHNTQRDSRWMTRSWETESRSAMAVPVTSSGDLLGVLTLVRANGSAFNEMDLALLLAIALCASLVAEEN